MLQRIEMSDGVKIHVQDLGTGPVVVLIAGFGLDFRLWDRQVRVLTAAGLRTICITQRGHGRSDHPLDGYSMDRLAADVAEVLGYIQVSTATVVGHSFGGQVAFHVAAGHPDLVAKLVLVGSNGVRASRSDSYPFGVPPETVLPRLISGEENNRIDARENLIRTTFATEPDPRVVDWLTRIWMEMPSWAAIEGYRTMQNADLLAEVAAVRQPVVQINGVADPIHSGRAANWLRNQLADATLIEMACGHFPMLEAPDEFDRLLLALTGVEPNS